LLFLLDQAIPIQLDASRAADDNPSLFGVSTMYSPVRFAAGLFPFRSRELGRDSRI
jgi:hypothetical protein